MAFDSLADFFAMGGYALYVWLSFGFSLVVLLGITVLSVRKSRQIEQSVLQMIDREQRMKQAGASDLL